MDGDANRRCVGLRQAVIALSPFSSHPLCLCAALLCAFPMTPRLRCAHDMPFLWLGPWPLFSLSFSDQPSHTPPGHGTTTHGGQLPGQVDWDSHHSYPPVASLTHWE